ncbi:MAG: LysE family translocator [Rhodospirillaceae bacterium]|nr:LysE family translocator [Rhodospirillaceae bacterium]
MAFDQWLIFVAIWTLAGLPLGPNALNCIAVSARIGFTRSLWSVAGILGAALCHKTAVIFGAATILLANAELFYVLTFCGAAYLIWMVISLWREGGELPQSSERAPASRFQIARQAFVISMSNPKAIFRISPFYHSLLARIFP